VKIWLKAVKTTGFMLICLAIYATALSAISKEINWQRMNKDLNILEGVLEKLMQYQNPSHRASFSEHDQVRGTYVEDYGALFLISSNQAVRFVNMWIHGQPQGQPEQPPDPENLQKELATEFLGTYCNTLGQLKNADRITLVFDTAPAEHNFTHYLSDLEHLSDPLKYSDAIQAFTHALHGRDLKVHIKTGYDDSPSDEAGIHIVQRIKRVDPSGKVDSVEVRKTVSQTPRERLLLEATVQKRDLVAYSQEKIDAGEFHKRIVFRKRSPKETIVKKVDIMSDILDSAIRGKTPGSSNPQTTGFYQENLGAVFFISQNAGLHLAWAQDAKTQPADPHETLKSTLIETIADYGHTLKGLKPKDQIVIHVDLTGSVDFHRVGNFALARARAYTFVGSPDQHGHVQATEQLLLRVLKKDVDAYHNGNLDLEAFRKKVSLQEI